MKFQITTDYAIRIMCYLLEHKNESATAKHISSELGITYQYFMKVINRLKQANLVRTIQGCNGGYMLAHPNKVISLYDVIRIMEGDLIINNCLAPEGFCSRDATPTCQLHKVFESLQYDLIEKLESVKLNDITMCQ
ncbi:MAG TPA: Rrf2 family transcriptional regulator [Candidatus Merdenecus merdavium]|nr:Rrf2 family transcriptional regulator [Candidatus Merdenecus merdavium]